MKSEHSAPTGFSPLSRLSPGVWVPGRTGPSHQGSRYTKWSPPRPLASTCLQATSQPTAHSTHCSQSRFCLPWAHGGSGGSTLPQPCSPCPGVSDWPLMGEGLWTPRVSPEELRSPFPARSRAEAEAQLREGWILLRVTQSWELGPFYSFWGMNVSRTSPTSPTHTLSPTYRHCHTPTQNPRCVISRWAQSQACGPSLHFPHASVPPPGPAPLTASLQLHPQTHHEERALTDCSRRVEPWTAI